MSNATKSGIITNTKTGERYIPSSVRADGSKRKEIKVRPGYKPPEDVELYKNRAAAAWKSRANGGVPGAEPLSGGEQKHNPPKPTSTKNAEALSGGEEKDNLTKATSTKNAKPREAKRAKDNDPKEGVKSDNWRTPPAKKEEPVQKPTQEPVDIEAEKEKKARNLKKKLRQARDLSEKKDQGEGLLPEQLQKVLKIQELVRQLEGLGFDSNGDKRTGENA